MTYIGHNIFDCLYGYPIPCGYFGGMCDISWISTDTNGADHMPKLPERCRDCKHHTGDYSYEVTYP
jgi:hypothetical protein